MLWGWGGSHGPAGRHVTRQIMEMTAAVRWADSDRPFMDHHHHSFSCPSPTEPSMTSGFKFDWNSNKTVTGLENCQTCYMVNKSNNGSIKT